MEIHRKSIGNPGGILTEQEIYRTSFRSLLGEAPSLAPLAGLASRLDPPSPWGACLPRPALCLPSAGLQGPLQGRHSMPSLDLLGISRNY